MTAKTKRLGGGDLYGRNTKKMCGETIKNTYRKLVPARLMIVLLLLGAAAVTCLHFGIQDQKRAARLLDEAKQEREIAGKRQKSGPGYLFECGR